MPLQIISRDILKTGTEVIVNPTDRVYSGSGGVDRQVHHAAGPELDVKCTSLPPLMTGEVRETPGYRLTSKYVIHTVGPVWEGGQSNEEALLRCCYVNALLLASRLGARSVAFPLISSGTFGFPKDRVLRLARQAISDFLFANDSDIEVFLCVLDRSAYELGLDKELKQSLDVTLRRNQCREREFLYAESQKLTCFAPTATFSKNAVSGLGEWLKKQDDTFAVTLLKLIDRKGMTDVECYKKANVSRKTFSKINNEKDYKPSKQTVIAFALALGLDLDETAQLLKTVGFSLSHSNSFDLIIEFCIRQGIYDVMEVNEILYQYDQPCLGC